jgi:hypothetical protein
VELSEWHIPYDYRVVTGANSPRICGRHVADLDTSGVQGYRKWPPNGIYTGLFECRRFNMVVSWNKPITDHKNSCSQSKHSADNEVRFGMWSNRFPDTCTGSQSVNITANQGSSYGSADEHQFCKVFPPKLWENKTKIKLLCSRNITHNTHAHFCHPTRIWGVKSKVISRGRSWLKALKMGLI